MPLDAGNDVRNDGNDSGQWALLLDGVRAFVAQEVMVRRTRPETALVAADFTAIRHAADEFGLLAAGADDYGLWSCLARREAPFFPLQALALLAEADPAVAWHLHGVALARAAAHLAALAVPADTTLLADGGVGMGRSALGRLLTGRVAATLDAELLADTFGQRPRPLLAPDGPAHALLLHFPARGACSLQLHRHEPAASADESAPHGLDGLALRRLVPATPLASAAISTTSLRTLLGAHWLALTAIALGTLRPAAAQARDYATLRRQGARTIIRHDAVAMLCNDIDTALAGATALLHDSDPAATADVIARRRLAVEALGRGANAAMQVFGGSGYMRDTGIEHRLRAINALRQLGGSPTELALVAAGCHADDAALPEDEAGDRHHLAGHVAADHILSPFSALQRTPLLRRLAAYPPREPWELDNDQLPAALARLRREVRAFAERELAPAAADIDLEQRDGHRDSRQLQALLARAGHAGLLTDLLPAPLGSAPLTRFRHPLAWQQAIRAEELARIDGGLMLLLSAPALGLCPLLLSGDTGLWRRVVLPAFRATRRGDPQLFAFAITEPAAGSDAEEGHGAAAQRAGVTAIRTDGGWLLRGRKIFISGGELARYVSVFAALGDEGYPGWTCFLVDTRTAGFRVARTELKMGMRASGAAELEFDDCFVADDHVVGGLRNGWALARATLNLSRLPVAAMAVGFAQAAVDIATDFACRQTLAGRSLAGYRDVQATLADLQAETAAIRALVWHHAASWRPRQGGASLSKFHATDRAQVVIERAMDLLGSHALEHRNRLERVFRDNRLTRIFEGTNEINRLAVIEDQQSLLLARIAAHQARPGTSTGDSP